MANLKAPRKTTASVIMLAVLVATPVGIAVAHPGFPTADVDLYQRAVWVTNEATGLLGLVNRQVRELTASVPVSAELDVLQWADTVVAQDRQNNAAGIVDAAVQRVPAQVALAPGTLLALGAGTLSVLDPVGGALWAIPADSGLEVELDAEQAVDVGRDALAVVSTDGTVFVASRAESSLLRIAGPGAQPERVGDLPKGELSITTVGERLVVASTTGSGTTITVVGGGSRELPSGPIRLQQPGPESDGVVIATADRLLVVPLGGGEAREVDFSADLAAVAADQIAAPVVVVGSTDGNCIYGAWAPSSDFVRSCADDEVLVQDLVGGMADDKLVFRVNRGSVVLNNAKTGVVYLVQDEMTVIEADDWLEVAPPEEDDEAPESDESTTQPSFDEIFAERTETNTPPEALNDDFGIRGDGRATVLRVLENDLDQDGDVLTIASVTGLSPEIAKLDIIDGGRALQITPVSTDAVTRTFGYTVTDGREGGIAQAVVTVTVAPPDGNRAPEAQRVSQVSVEASGTISYNVLADWRDPDGDDVYLTSAVSSAGDSVRFTPDGLVTLTHSGTEPGERTLSFTVSDGTVEINAQPIGELRVAIEPGGSLPPLTVPDFSQAFVGQEVVIDPLENDVARSTRDIGLISMEPQPGAEGVSWTPVPDSAQYRFGASEPGTYYFIYDASTGAGSESKGILRLDVFPDPDSLVLPIAVKDTAYLRPGEPLTVPVLANDVSPSGAVLGIQSVGVPRDEAERGLTVEVLGGAYLRVASTSAQLDPVVVTYTISDGESSATSSVTVVPIPETSTHQSPIARDDRITVRSGDTASIEVLGNDLHPDGALMTLNPDLIQGFEGTNGIAFVQGSAVRLQAPSKPGTYALVYRVDDAFSEYATAQILVTVTPIDSETNAPPLPPTITARVQAGGELTVDIPTSGVDVDGDSVMLLSATGASFGQVSAVGLTGFQYRAGSGPGGTEVIRYTVQDAFGVRGQGEVRIGVIPAPEVPLPPVAVDDVAEVQPGATVAVRVLDNDSDPANSAITLSPELLEVQEGIVAEVLDGGVIAITAGELAGSFVLRYEIGNAQGGVDDAFVKVAVTPDARPQSPLAQDHVLAVTDILGLEQVEVDMLEGAFNPDGLTDELVVATVGPGAVSVDGLTAGTALISLTDRRQAIAYTLTSVQSGLSATGFVVVPAVTSALPPYLKQEFVDSPPALAIGATTTLQIRDLVEVPSGGVLVIVGEAVISATSGLDSVSEVTETEVRVTPNQEQRGDAQSITVLVTDGITDVDGGTPIEIPVIVGDPESRDVPPVFTPFEVLVEADGAATERDLRAAVSHPNPSIIQSLQFDAELSGATGALRVAVSGGTLTASAPLGGAQPGDEVVVDLTLNSDQLLTDPVTTRVTVRVVPSTRPLVQTVNDLRADGRSSSSYVISPLDNDFNPFAAIGGESTLEDAEFEGDPLGARFLVTGNTVTVTTGPAKSGTISIVYTVRDASREVSRDVQGRMTVIVTSAPESPTFSAAPQRGGSQTLSITFSPPLSWNGSPEAPPPYTVRAFAASSNAIAATRTDCVAGLACTFTSLTNGAAYFFVVTATNGVGDSAPSAQSASAIPLDRPGAPASASLSGGTEAWPGYDARITGSWAEPSYTGGGVDYYEYSFNGGARVATTSFSQNFQVPAGSHTLRVWACNPVGCSDASTQSAPRGVTQRSPQFSISKGTARQFGFCNTTPCAEIRVAGQYFPPGTTVQIGIESDCRLGFYGAACTARFGTPFVYVSSVVDANGNFVNTDRLFGFPGAQIRVLINGTYSNTITW